MVDDSGIPANCCKCGKAVLTLRWAEDHWRVLHRDAASDACPVSKQEAHVLLEGR